MAAVDVIVPLFNKKATIERAIQSIRTQSMSDWRLIVVDDGSTDGSPDIVRRLQAEDKRIELIGQANAGPGAARNTGIRAATAQWLAFLDADDQWYPWHLQTGVDAIAKNDVCLIGTMYYEWPAQVDMSRHWMRQGVVPGVYHLTGNEAAERFESFLYFFTMDTIFLKAQAARRLGGFGESGCRHGEDTILIAKLILNEPFMVLGEKPSARYNRDESELTKGYCYPLNPMLLEPEILLKYCSQEKRELAKMILARMALRNAYFKARNGFKEEAVKLAELHPQMKTFGRAWRQCEFAIRYSWILPYWVLLKCVIGPRVRGMIRKAAYTFKMTVPPPEI